MDSSSSLLPPPEPRPAEPPPLASGDGPHTPPPLGPGLSSGDQQRSWLRRKLGAAGAALIAILAKLKAILLFLPKIKVLATAGTMAVSVVAYAAIWGFPFALGFATLILVHEMGHVIQLRREGVKASAPIFIPFLGAVIGARMLGKNAFAEAKVGLAGPILGSVGAAACIPIWKATGNDMWGALAFTGFLLNLFNLIPVVPLDGGRAVAAMSPWMWPVGFGLLVVLAFIKPNPVFVLILILGAFEIYRRWQRHKAGGDEEEGYYKVAPRDRLLIGVTYIALIALLVLGMSATNLPRTIP